MKRQINVAVPEQFAQKVKSHAVDMQMSMTEYITRALSDLMAKPKAAQRAMVKRKTRGGPIKLEETK